MKKKHSNPIVIKCGSCGHENVFNQPYKYHAGFGNQGFLYNEAGNCTLTWSSFDPDYEAIVGANHPWALDQMSQKKIEDSLKLSPYGDHWGFKNPARCLECKKPISQPIDEDIYFLKYDNSVDLDPNGQKGVGFKDELK